MSGLPVLGFDPPKKSEHSLQPLYGGILGPALLKLDDRKILDELARDGRLSVIPENEHTEH